MSCPYVRDHPPQFSHVRSDFNAELAQQFLAHGSAGNAGDGLTGAGTLQDIAGVRAVILERAREIGVARPWPGDLAPPAQGVRRGLRFGRHDGLPGSRISHPGPKAPAQWIGSGGPHIGFDGFGFTTTGSSIITRPFPVTPNSHCRVLLRLRATRSGPMIGSRTTIVPI